MVFRDRQLVCQECGKTFFFTVTEQRRLAEELGDVEVTPPERCPECRQKIRPPSVRPEHTPRETKPPAEPAIRSQVPTEAVDEFPHKIEGIEVKLIGEIKWYRPEKGYGFIAKADGQEIFFHRTGVVGKTYQLAKGTRVEFQVRQTQKGPEAFNVSILPPA